MNAMTQMPNLNNIFEALSSRTIGFDYLKPFFSENVSSGNRYPPFDLIKKENDSYMLVLAIAGFSQENVEISVERDVLTVAGNMEHTDNSDSYIVEGIAKRKFVRKWTLGNHIKVDHASMKDGLLYIHLVTEIPEADKPKLIEIK